jgi:DNA-binding transcriptional regulator/RsmH inhibitor MraZ
MSNQRPGKTHRAALGDSMQEMHLRNFFRSCKEILAGTDAEFYFEQIQEHIEAGNSLPQDKREIQRLFGV